MLLGMPKNLEKSRNGWGGLHLRDIRPDRGAESVLSPAGAGNAGEGLAELGVLSCPPQDVQVLQAVGAVAIPAVAGKEVMVRFQPSWQDTGMGEDNPQVFRQEGGHERKAVPVLHVEGCIAAGIPLVKPRLGEIRPEILKVMVPEKTAVICAGFMPGFLWLATGGKQAINDRLLVLWGRKVLAFPDIDGYDEWQRKLAEYPQLGVTISPILQQNATAEDREAHIDIADWLMRSMGVGEYCHSERSPQGGVEESRRHCADFLLAAKYLDPEMAPEVEAMIDELGLMFVGAWKVEKTDEKLPP